MINLFTTIYKDKNPDRQAELDYCVNKNLHNKNLNTILLENEERVSFNYLFDVINKYTGLNDVNIIANTDIYFDETVLLANKLHHNEMWTLSRWDVQRDGTAEHFCRKNSQDVWIWLGKVKGVRGDFALGFLGSDNRIAYEFDRAGYKVSNPSLSIKSYHLHLTNIRNYEHSAKFTVPPPYKMIEPTSIL